MRIQAADNDAEQFVAAVDGVVDGLMRRYQPTKVILIQIDNWFGTKWLGFSGVAMLQLGVRRQTLTIPPFVPNRVISQRTFVGPFYEEVGSGEPIHLRVSSRVAIGRKASEVAPNATLVWYSANSKSTGRGSLMVYFASGDAYRPWYSQWEGGKSWHLAKSTGIEPLDLLNLMNRNGLTDTLITA